LVAGTSWTDPSQTGDAYFTDEFVDNVLGSYRGSLGADARLYAGPHDSKEPLLSPVCGGVSGFPPTILLSGTRALFLSNTLRMHQKLLQSGVRADPLVFEGNHARSIFLCATLLNPQLHLARWRPSSAEISGNDIEPEFPNNDLVHPRNVAKIVEWVLGEQPRRRWRR
jgi:acetyl esterase/lipase